MLPIMYLCFIFGLELQTSNFKLQTPAGPFCVAFRIPGVRFRKNFVQLGLLQFCISVLLTITPNLLRCI